MSLDAGNVIDLVTSIVAAVGPEVARAIIGHGAESPAIPPSARAAVRAILYPDGGALLASEIEHAADVAALADASPPTKPGASRPAPSRSPS